jgi:hypothetical protein
MSYDSTEFMKSITTRGGMVIVLFTNVVDRVIDPRSLETNYYKIGICEFYAKYTRLRNKNKDWLFRNKDSVHEWSDISIHRLLFQWASTL